MAINGRSVISAPDFQVDPRFLIPVGVSGVSYTTPSEDADTGGLFTSSSDAVSGTGVVDTGSGSEPQTANPGIPVPDTATIISQTIRIVPGGGIVVDVEMEVTNSANNDSFEVRLAKL